MTPQINPQELRSRLKSSEEIAVLDVREEGVFFKKHLFISTCVPYSQLEFLIGDLVPRTTTPIVVVHGGDEDVVLAESAAERLVALGYQEVVVLQGGVDGWEKAGGEVFLGLNVQSKAFGEWVEQEFGTPHVSALEFKQWCEGGRPLVNLDSRTLEEFQRFCIPGGIACPGAELSYRAVEQIPNPETIVVVNCAGRTRSIVGAQSLINSGLPNPVYALENGAAGWVLSGLDLQHDSKEIAAPPGSEALETSKTRAQAIADALDIHKASPSEVEEWRAEPGRTTLLLDIRTKQEYVAGHWPGAQLASGGELIQATDSYFAVQGARLVLCDNTDAVRATITASWLMQMGFDHVSILAGNPPNPETGFPQGTVLGFKTFPHTITHEELGRKMDAESAPPIIDLANSKAFNVKHIPGSYWGIRSRIGECIDHIADCSEVVLTSPDGRLAHLTACNLSQIRSDLRIRVLEGGTDAWELANMPVASGMQGTLTEVDDLWWHMFDVSLDRRDKEARDYLDWELQLLEQLRNEPLAQFRRLL